MTKEFISRRGIPFEGMDVENDPAAAAALAELGYKAVPVVARGKESVFGWNPTRLAALLEVAHQEQAAPPAELIRSLQVVLEGALRAVRQVPDDKLGMRSPDRDRPLRQLAHHIFHVIEVSVDADVLQRFPGRTWLAIQDPVAHTSAERIARYGEAVRAKFTTWYTGRDPAAFDREIQTDDDGVRTLGLVLERTRSHSAQHLRQIYEFLRWCGVEPDRPLSQEDLRGIDLPEAVW